MKDGVILRMSGVFQEYKTLITQRDTSQQRRDRNRAAGLCINENKAGTHGRATHGCRCQHCYEVHRGRSNYQGRKVG